VYFKNNTERTINYSTNTKLFKFNNEFDYLKIYTKLDFKGLTSLESYEHHYPETIDLNGISTNVETIFEK